MSDTNLFLFCIISFNTKNKCMRGKLPIPIFERKTQVQGRANNLPKVSQGQSQDKVSDILTLLIPLAVFPRDP